MTGALAGRPLGDGRDSHSLLPDFMNVPNAFLERCETLADSGGAGLHRGGNGIDMVYRFLEAGMIAIHVWRTPGTPLAIAAE